MLDNEIIKVKISGGFACYTRPDLKVERMTYPCTTPSAARGVLDSILWKPEFQWWIHRILILKPVSFFSVKRNEINAKQEKSPIIIEEKRSQRNSIILKDVEYVIEASVYQKELDPKNPPKKYTEMFKRRIKKGQCWRRPYLGTREFPAEFSTADGCEPTIKQTIPIGNMLFDIFYDENGIPSPIFFEAAIVDGILECPKEENEKMMQSSHIQIGGDVELSALIYAFNKSEEGRQ